MEHLETDNVLHFSPRRRVIRSGALPPMGRRSADPAKNSSQFIGAVLGCCGGAGRQTVPAEGLIPSEPLHSQGSVSPAAAFLYLFSVEI